MADLARLDAPDVVEAAQLFHQVLSVDRGVVTCAARSQDQVVDLLQLLGVLLQTSQSDHGLISHEPSSVIERLLDALWLVQHLHSVVVVDARWQLNPHLLLCHCLEHVRLNAVSQRQLHDFLILNIVVPFGVVLKHGGVGCHDLEVMSLGHFCLLGRDAGLTAQQTCLFLSVKLVTFGSAQSV